MTFMKLVRGVFKREDKRLPEPTLPFFVIALCLGMFVVAIVMEFETQLAYSANQAVIFATL